MELKSFTYATSFGTKGHFVNKTSKKVLEEATPAVYRVFNDAINAYADKTSRVKADFNITDAWVDTGEDGFQALFVELIKPRRFGGGNVDFNVSYVQTPRGKVYLSNIAGDHPNKKFFKPFMNAIVSKFEKALGKEPELTFDELISIRPGPEQYKVWEKRGYILRYEDEMPGFNKVG